MVGLLLIDKLCLQFNCLHMQVHRDLPRGIKQLHCVPNACEVSVSNNISLISLNPV